MSSVSREYRPSRVLVIEPGLFEGFGIRAKGAVALYALCMTINRVLHRMNGLAPDLGAYVQPGPPAGEPGNRQ